MIYETLMDERNRTPKRQRSPYAIKRTILEHPRTIAQKYITVETIEKVMKRASSPSDHTLLVINSIMCALDEVESWPRALKVMKNRASVLQRLLNYPCDSITMPKLRKIEAYVTKSNYRPELFGTQSQELQILSEWVLSLVSYARGRVSLIK